MKQSVSATGASFSPLVGVTLAEARTELATLKRDRAVIDARIIAVTAHIDALATAEHPEFAIPERELMTHAGMSGREARDTVARAHVAETAPDLAALLAVGDTTVAHLDAVGRGLRLAGDDRDAFLAELPRLTEAATTMSVKDFDSLVKKTASAVQTDGGLAVFENQRRSTYLSTWTDRDGMTQVRGQFDPISGMAFVSLLERQVERMFHGGDEPVIVAPGIEPNAHRRARALIALIDQPTSDTTDPITERPTRAEVVVHVDLATLINGLGCTGVCRTALGNDIPAETARRLACEADIIPMVLGGNSVPLDVGRSRRLATVHQRRALEAIHPTCAIPDCDVGFHHCQIHHIDYWEHGGRTDMNNQIPLCSKHHHAAHEGGWKLTLDPTTRVVTVRR
ncbi:MAG: DUF222 domain-containing protein [Actinomycetota bacterium]